MSPSKSGMAVFTRPICHVRSLGDALIVLHREKIQLFFFFEFNLLHEKFDKLYYCDLESRAGPRCLPTAGQMFGMGFATRCAAGELVINTTAWERLINFRGEDAHEVCEAGCNC